MSGRFTEELKRITREQGHIAEPTSSEPTVREHWSRRYAPLAAMVVAVAIAIIGWLVVRQLMADSKLQDCVMSGRKNCAPIQPHDPSLDP